MRMAPAVGLAVFANHENEPRLFVSNYLDLIDDRGGIEGVHRIRAHDVPPNIYSLRKDFTGFANAACTL